MDYKTNDPAYIRDLGRLEYVLVVTLDPVRTFFRSARFLLTGRVGGSETGGNN